MKKLVCLINILAIFIIGCEKQEIQDQLHGDWKIVAVSGSILGWASIRDFDKVCIRRSNKYSVYFNDTSIRGGSYKIDEEPWLPDFAPKFK